MGAFLHDIGHLLQVQDVEHMYTDGIQLGVVGHERKGEEFLKSLGIPKIICDIVRGHVDAKRYLCYRDSEYYQSKLTDIGGERKSNILCSQNLTISFMILQNCQMQVK